MTRTALGLVLLLVLAVSANATSGEWVDVTCPVCGNEFEGWAWSSTNTVGGVDVDGCEHAAGGQVFLKICWTCPSCLYTGMQHEWQDEDERPVALIQRLKVENPLKAREPIDPKTQKTTSIPAALRWDLYLQVLALRDAGGEQRLGALLRAAWTQRFDAPWSEELAQALRSLSDAYWVRMRARVGKRRNPFQDRIDQAHDLERDAVDEALALSDRERQHRLLLAAWAYKARGEDPDAVRVLDVLAARHAKAPDVVLEAADNLRARTVWERRYLGEALPLLKSLAETEDIPDDARPWVNLRIAELERKAGDAKVAAALFQSILDGEVPERLREMVTERLQRMAAPQPPRETEAASDSVK